MNLRHFEVLRAVWQCGSTTEAARLLNVSQPAISKMLREAEEQLGVRVFDREGGRLKTRMEAAGLISAIERVLRQFVSNGNLTEKSTGGVFVSPRRLCFRSMNT